MPHELYVLLRDENLPTLEAWQAVLDSHQSGLQFGKFNPREDIGEVVVQLEKSSTKLQIFEGSIKELNHLDKAQVGDRNRYVLFELSDDPYEIQAAVLAAAGLTVCASGLFFDPQSNEYADGAQVFSLIKQAQSGKAKPAKKNGDPPRPHRRCVRCRTVCPPHRARCRICGSPVTDSNPVVELPKPRSAWWRFWE